MDLKMSKPQTLNSKAHSSLPITDHRLPLTIPHHDYCQKNVSHNGLPHLVPVPLNPLRKIHQQSNGQEQSDTAKQ